ncbi:MAG: ROK family protein [Thermoleophilia bacterium]
MMMMATGDGVKGVMSAPGGAVLAIDLGATWTRAAVVSFAGEIAARSAARTPADGAPERLAEAVLTVAARALAAAGAPGDDGVVAVGVASVGPLDAHAGVLVAPPNLGGGYRGLDLATPLRRRFDVPVFVERDTNVAALGEHAYGAAKGIDDFVYLTVSTGLGGAIFSRGCLLTGASGVAGELGHIPVMIGGPLCGCGGVGHLEALCSGTAIARAGRDAGISVRPDVSGVAVSSVGGALAGATSDALAASEPPALTAADVAAAEQAGDERAAAIMRRAREAFAAGVVGIVNALNPRLIVVGGGIARAEGERLLGPAREAVAASALAPAAAAVELVPAALGDDVGLIGCVRLVAGGEEESWQR